MNHTHAIGLRNAISMPIGLGISTGTHDGGVEISKYKVEVRDGDGDGDGWRTGRNEERWEGRKKGKTRVNGGLKGRREKKSAGVAGKRRVIDSGGAKAEPAMTRLAAAKCSRKSLDRRQQATVYSL